MLFVTLRDTSIIIHMANAFVNHFFHVFHISAKSRRYGSEAVSYKSFPMVSITTITGKSFTCSLRIASVPKSSYAITSDETMARDSSAPAPPMAAKYTALLRTIASFTVWRRRPFPIIPRSPLSSRTGAYLSMRLAVVGPAEPMALPSLAGEGPI